MASSPVKIFTASDSPRLRYIVSFIMDDILGLPWEITTDKRKIRKPPVINYSNVDIPGSFRIIPDDLLFEEGLRKREIVISTWNKLPVFFTSPGGDLPFDLFAASFYLVSRYEEYIDDDTDEHGRFKALSSVAYKNGFLDKPVVDLWVMEFAKVFVRKFRNIAIKHNDFRNIVTIDADEPYANPGGFFASIVYKKKHGEKDPYDVFDYIMNSVNSSGTDILFFIPVGDKSKYDKNPSWKHTAFRKLISEISAAFVTGLHPSYKAGFDQQEIKKEKGRLSKITRKKTSASRFHYLRFRLPESLRHLIACGIKEDYSMGYSGYPGFRAGVSRSFYFYDLLKEQQTSLRIYPFQIMDEDIICKDKKGLELAKDQILAMISEVRQSGGTFISIWHNTTLVVDEKHRYLRELFEFLLKSQNGNLEE